MNNLYINLVKRINGQDKSFTPLWKSSFQFTAKLKGRYKDFPYTLMCVHTHAPPGPPNCRPNTWAIVPVVNIPHQSGTFVEIDKATLKQSPKIPYLTLMLNLGGVHSVVVSWCSWYIHIHNDVLPISIALKSSVSAFHPSVCNFF